MFIITITLLHITKHLPSTFDFWILEIINRHIVSCEGRSDRVNVNAIHTKLFVMPILEAQLLAKSLGLHYLKFNLLHMNCNSTYALRSLMTYFVIAHTVLHEWFIPCSKWSFILLLVSTHFYPSLSFNSTLSFSKFLLFQHALSSLPGVPFHVSGSKSRSISIYVLRLPSSFFPRLLQFTHIRFPLSPDPFHSLQPQNGTELPPSGLVCSVLQHWRM